MFFKYTSQKMFVLFIDLSCVFHLKYLTWQNTSSLPPPCLTFKFANAQLGKLLSENGFGAQLSEALLSQAPSCHSAPSLPLGLCFIALLMQDLNSHQVL